MAAEATRVGTGKRAAIYCRAPEPAEYQRTPVAEQRAASEALASALGYAIDAEATLLDRGPGTTTNRPGLRALLGLIAAGQLDAVIVYTLDRLALEGSELKSTLLKEFRRRSIPLYIAKLPRGYRYDQATGALTHDAAEVAAGNQEEWRRPDYIIIPTE